MRPTLELGGEVDFIGHSDLEDSIRTHEAQGITTGDNSWYMVAGNRVWKYPLAGSLRSHIESNNSVSAANPLGPRTDDHLGDLVYADGKVYVAGHGHTIVVFDKDLNYLGMADASAPHLAEWSLRSALAWIAHDPARNRFYSSDFDMAWWAESFEIVDCTVVSNCDARTTERFELRDPRPVHFVKEGTGELQGIARVQGGAVADQTLYLTSDVADGGIVAVDLSYFNVDPTRRGTGHVRGFAPVTIDKGAGDNCRTVVHTGCAIVGGIALGPLGVIGGWLVCDQVIPPKHCEGLKEELQGVTVHNGSLYAVLQENDVPFPVGGNDSLILKRVDILGDPNAGACRGALP
ncbi:MAG: PQQ-binding-like beta-propeller repeat protein [Myxococcales bacterium]|nr:PQQ-binding-like beta-propeller repeat protein [Myxococcales bacterium]